MSAEPGDGPQIAVDVVILTWNDGKLLDRCLESVQGSAGVQLTIWVIDNGSTPPAEVFSGRNRVNLVRNDENRGIAWARNQGARLGGAPLLCFVDSDALVSPHTLGVLAAALDDPSVAMSAPVFEGQAPEASAGRAPGLQRKIARGLNLTTMYAPTHRGGDDKIWDVEFAIGACQMVRRSVFEIMRGFDESYFYGPEDVDFCLRIRAHGFRTVQVANTGCHHPPRRRNKKLLTRRGVRHGWAVVRYLVRRRRQRPFRE